MQPTTQPTTQSTNNQTTNNQTTNTQTTSSNTINELEIDIVAVEQQIRDSLLTIDAYRHFVEAIGIAINKITS